MYKLGLGPYIGGKRRAAEKYADILNYDVTTYIEGFGGMGNVLLNKGTHEIEVYNELHYPIYNLFRVISQPELYEVLRTKIFSTGYSEETYNSAKAEFIGDEKDFQKGINNINKDNAVDKAILVLMLLKQSINGDLTKLRFRGIKEGNEEADYLGSFYGLDDVAERIRGVKVLNKDINKLLIEHHNNSDICWFLDPPYDPEVRTKRLYSVDMDDESKQLEFLRTVRHIKGKAAICGYKSDLYDSLLNKESGWSSFVIAEVTKSMQFKQAGESKDVVSEWVWVNYKI